MERVKWHFEEFHPLLKPVLPAVKRFASDVLRHRRQPSVLPYWLTILGPSGVGKTLVLTQLFQWLHDNDYRWPVQCGDDGSERFARCAHIQPGIDLEDHRAPKDFSQYDLLYVEDIGAGAGPVVTARTLELMLYRPGRWTLLDANMSAAEMATKIDRRLTSRLKRDGSILIELPAEIPDYNFR